MLKIMDIFEALNSNDCITAEKLLKASVESEEKMVRMLNNIVTSFSGLHTERDEAVLKTSVEIIRYLFGINTQVNFNKAKTLLTMLVNMLSPHTRLIQNLTALTMYLEKMHEQAFA